MHRIATLYPGLNPIALAGHAPDDADAWLTHLSLLVEGGVLKSDG